MKINKNNYSKLTIALVIIGVLAAGAILSIYTHKNNYEILTGRVSSVNNNESNDGGVAIVLNGKVITLCGVGYNGPPDETCPTMQYIPKQNDIVEVKLRGGTLLGCNECYVKKVE